MIQYRVKWPNGRESLLSEEAYSIYMRYFTSGPLNFDLLYYDALLTAEKINKEDTPDES